MKPTAMRRWTLKRSAEADALSGNGEDVRTVWLEVEIVEEVDMEMGITGSGEGGWVGREVGVDRSERLEGSGPGEGDDDGRGEEYGVGFGLSVPSPSGLEVLLGERFGGGGGALGSGPVGPAGGGRPSARAKTVHGWAT